MSCCGRAHSRLDVHRARLQARRARARAGGAIGTLWARTWAESVTWDTGQLEIAILNPGQTIARVHFGWRAFGVTSNEQDMQALAQDFMGIGVVTQASTTGPTAPDAITHADDANPPLERWLWWATTSMRPMTMGSEHPDIMCWGTDITTILDDTKGMAKANVGAGDTLDVYLTWSPWTTAGWTVRGDVAINCWASALVLT